MLLVCEALSYLAFRQIPPNLRALGGGLGIHLVFLDSSLEMKGIENSDKPAQPLRNHLSSKLSSKEPA